MALDKRKTIKTGPNFLIRSLGLLGLLVFAIGLVVLSAQPVDSEDMTARMLSIGGMIVGGGLVILALYSEYRYLLAVGGASRGAFASNVFLQVLLALVLLIGINIFSFLHYERIDWTRNQLFTIAPEIVEDLQRLRGETTIVVLQRHTSFGRSENTDHYDSAAERKIVDKVKDLVDQFQEFSPAGGPRFRVLHLDIQEEKFQEKLKMVKQDKPKLAKAIENTQESSIFFYAKGEEGDPHIQRLAFHDIYQLDRKASLERGNLVLNYQGEGPFARKILNIQEPRPKVAIAVVHELLGAKGSEFHGLPGLEKAFKEHNFEFLDIILKDWEKIPPEPSVRTHSENDYAFYEKQVAILKDKIENKEELVEDLRQKKELFGKDLDQLNKEAVLVKEGGVMFPVLKSELEKEEKKPNTVPFTRDAQEFFLDRIAAVLNQNEYQLKENRLRYNEAKEKLDELEIEDVEELSRITDVKAKFKRLLNEVDLLVIPRFTLRNLSEDEVLPNFVHYLGGEQVEAIKEFMKAGKPVLFCLGPSNIPNQMMAQSSRYGSNKLESMLEKLGIPLPNQTVMFEVETESFARLEPGVLIAPKDVKIPGVKFDWKPGATLPGIGFLQDKKSGTREAHPIRKSLLVASRAFGKDQPPLSLRHPRPVYYQPSKTEPPREDAVLMVSDPATWNESDPFPTLESVPQFDPPKVGDPNKGTLEEERQGPFPIAVAAEVDLPFTWFLGKEGNETGKKSVRLVVIGHGTAFQGETLNPMQEKLFFDSCNWLLGREDLLATPSENPQEYARVELSEPQFVLWRWGTLLGLPGLALILGILVLMYRGIW